RVLQIAGNPAAAPVAAVPRPRRRSSGARRTPAVAHRANPRAPRSGVPWRAAIGDRTWWPASLPIARDEGNAREPPFVGRLSAGARARRTGRNRDWGRLNAK